MFSFHFDTGEESTSATVIMVHLRRPACTSTGTAQPSQATLQESIRCFLTKPGKIQVIISFDEELFTCPAQTQMSRAPSISCVSVVARYNLIKRWSQKRAYTECTSESKLGYSRNEGRSFFEVCPGSGQEPQIGVDNYAATDGFRVSSLTIYATEGLLACLDCCRPCLGVRTDGNTAAPAGSPSPSLRLDVPPAARPPLGPDPSRCLFHLEETRPVQSRNTG